MPRIINLTYEVFYGKNQALPFFQLPSIVWSLNLHWDTILHMKLINGVTNLITWLYLNMLAVYKLYLSYVTKVTTPSIISFPQGASLVQVSTLYHAWKLR